MKKIKVFDCFPYFNEKEILELRIKMLYDHVDGFIIVDANKTHGGHPKEFSCKKVLQELNIPSDKINVIELNLPSFEEHSDNYFRERTQRNVAAQYFEDDAVYIVTDCDEIIDPEMIPVYVDGAVNNPNNIMRISLHWLNCKVNLQICDPNGGKAIFNSAFVCMKHHVENYTLSEIREDEACQLRKIKYTSLSLLDQEQKIIDCGWHFSWMGGRDRIKTKMRSFLHCYDGKNDIFTTAVGDIPSKEMEDYLNSYEPKDGSNDTFGRTDYFLKEFPIEKLPKKLFELEHLKHFFGLDNE